MNNFNSLVIYKEPPPPLSRLYMGVVLTFTNMHSLVMSTLTSISSTPTRRVSFNSQIGPTYTVPEHLSISHFHGVHSLVLCVVFVDHCFILSLFWPLHCLPFFELWRLTTPLVYLIFPYCPYVGDVLHP